MLAFEIPRCGLQLIQGDFKIPKGTLLCHDKGNIDLWPASLWCSNILTLLPKQNLINYILIPISGSILCA